MSVGVDAGSSLYKSGGEGGPPGKTEGAGDPRGSRAGVGETTRQTRDVGVANTRWALQIPPNGPHSVILNSHCHPWSRERPSSLFLSAEIQRNWDSVPFPPPHRKSHDFPGPARQPRGSRLPRRAITSGTLYMKRTGCQRHDTRGYMHMVPDGNYKIPPPPPPPKKVLPTHAVHST